MCLLIGFKRVEFDGRLGITVLSPFTFIL